MREGWTAKPFEACLDPVSYPSKVRRQQFKAEGRFPIISQEREFINGYWDEESDVLEVDRPLVVFGDHTQILKYVDFDFVLGADGVKLLRPKADINPRYFYYFLLANPIPTAGYARHYRFLRDLIICYPTLSEQQRIVAILDEFFAGLAIATANAEKNLKNARELFDSCLQGAFSDLKSRAALHELAVEITDGDHSPPPKAASGVPFITISNIAKDSREIDFSDTFFVPREYFDRLKPNKKPRSGDVLYTVTGATLGIPVLVKDQKDFCFQRHIGLIRPGPDVDNAWLAYALSSPQVFAQATLGSTGTAQKTVSLAVLRNIEVPKINLREQQEIAGKLDRLAERSRRLERIYRLKVESLAALKGAILQKAFSGELTAPPLNVIKEAAE